MSQKHPVQPVATPISSDALRRLQLALEAMIVAAGASGVLLFNGRSGSVTLVDTDILSALGYTPAEELPGHIPISIVDLPEADPAEPLVRWRVPAMTIEVEEADAGVAATSPSALRFRKNSVDQGTLTFTGTSGVASFSTIVYADGDLMEIYPPSSIDATLDRVSVTLGVS